MKYFLIFTFFFVLVISCLKTQTTDSTDPPPQDNEVTFFKTIPMESFMTIVNENINNPDYVLIDVRTPSEFQSGHIKNAILIEALAKIKST